MDLCYFAETQLCEDLLNFKEVIEFKTEAQLVRVCKDFEIVACAKIDFTNKTCTIYLSNSRGLASSSLRHERNHCRGWDHENINNGQYFFCRL